MAFSDLEILGMSYGYTDETVLGGGAIKGKNCTIKSITEITGGHRVTFEWTLDDGTVQTDTMDVMDGAAPAGTYVDKDQFDDNFDTIPGGNILELSDTVLKAGSVTAVIKDNVITLNGTVAANNYLYIKLSGTVAMVQATGAKAVPDAWAQETVSGLENGKKYAFNAFCLGGSIQTGATAPLMTLKDSSKNTLQSAGALFTYAGGGAFFQLVCGKESVFNNFKVAVMVTEDAVPGQFVENDLALEAYKELYKPYVYKLSNEASYLTISNADYDSSKTMYCQGLCVADGYLYISFINNPHTYLNKYLLSDGSLVASQQMDQLHHANAITYNPFDGYLYIVDLDSPNVIHKVTTELSYVSYIEIDLTDVYPGYTGIGAVSFNRKRCEFVCLLRGSTRKGYAIFDSSFTFKDIVWAQKMSGTYGTILAEDDYIYQVTSWPGMVHVFAYNGKYVGRLHDLGKLSLEENTSKWECESISIVGDKLYFAYSSAVQNESTYVDVFDITEKVQGLTAKI